jgi:hypothetical protein
MKWELSSCSVGLQQPCPCHRAEVLSWGLSRGGGHRMGARAEHFFWAFGSRWGKPVSSGTCCTTVLLSWKGIWLQSTKGEWHRQSAIAQRVSRESRWEVPEGEVGWRSMAGMVAPMRVPLNGAYRVKAAPSQGLSTESLSSESLCSLLILRLKPFGLNLF